MVNVHLQYLKKLKHSDQKPVGNNANTNCTIFSILET